MDDAGVRKCVFYQNQSATVDCWEETRDVKEISYQIIQAYDFRTIPTNLKKAPTSGISLLQIAAYADQMIKQENPGPNICASSTVGKRCIITNGYRKVAEHERPPWGFFRRHHITAQELGMHCTEEP